MSFSLIINILFNNIFNQTFEIFKIHTLFILKALKKTIKY